jgi:hypothetical protein
VVGRGVAVAFPSLAAAGEEQRWRGLWCRCRGGHLHSWENERGGALAVLCFAAAAVSVAVAVVVSVQRWAVAYPGRGGAVAFPSLARCCCGGRGGGGGDAGAGVETGIPWWLEGELQLHPLSLAAAAEEQRWRGLWCRCRSGHWHTLGGEVQLRSLSLAAAAAVGAAVAVGVPVGKNLGYKSLKTSRCADKRPAAPPQATAPKA